MIHKQNPDELVGCEFHGPCHTASRAVEEYTLWNKEDFYFCIWASCIIWDLGVISPTFFYMGFVSSDSHVKLFGNYNFT